VGTILCPRHLFETPCDLKNVPFAPALNAIGGKWKPVIVYHLLEGPNVSENYGN
jgi:DNA-binding HxlR family transcriptional regulator